MVKSEPGFSTNQNVYNYLYCHAKLEKIGCISTYVGNKDIILPFTFASDGIKKSL